MFHLFNKVYLNYIEELNNQKDFITCFRTRADKVSYESDLFNTGNFVLHLKHSYNLNELIDSFGGEESFIRQLLLYKGTNEDNNLIIYCDPENYTKFIIKYWKSVFPNIDVENCYKLYSVYKAKNLLQTRVIFFNNKEYNHVSCSYWDQDFNSFSKKFELYTPFKVPKIFNSNISIEYLIGYKLANDLSYEDSLKFKYETIYNKFLSNEIMNIFNELEDMFFNLNAIWSDLGELDYDNLEKTLKIKPSLHLLGNTNLKKCKNLEEFSKIEDLKEIYKIISDYNKWQPEMILDYPLLNYLKNNNYKIPDYNFLLEEDLNYITNKNNRMPILGSLHREKKLNMFTIDFFRKMKDSKPENLKFFKSR